MTRSAQRGARRIALVTGGSRGIGRAAAERLSSDGFDVIVTYSSDKGEADSLASGIGKAGGRCLVIQADVADEEAMAAIFDSAPWGQDGVDVVVNAAGLLYLGEIADLDLNRIDAMIRTNLRGSLVVSKLAARNVRTGGAIIHFSSSVLGLSFPGYGGYTATKGGVEAKTLILARELRGRDVTVNAIAPGPTATAMFLDSFDEATIKEKAQATPLERLGEVGDVAEVVSFLAGPSR